MNESRAALRARMQRLLAQWRASGQSLSGFAREQGITRDKLEYWKRRLDPDSETKAELVPVRVVAAEDAGAAIEVVLTSGDRMLVHEGSSAGLLREVVGALRPGC